ncbi:MAG: hypothetical protein CMJ94_01510 [Planctomycetes bacterium]|nr:hypothetical protein [Planctomycetota bacterium]
MGQHGRIAEHAVRRIREDGLEPADAWAVMAAELYAETPGLQDRGCARAAFLGLCAAGKVRGVAASDCAEPGKDQAYALRALEILQEDLTLAHDQDTLWRHVLDGRTIRHNAQMDVVCTLFRAGMLAAD